MKTTLTLLYIRRMVMLLAVCLMVTTADAGTDIIRWKDYEPQPQMTRNGQGGLNYADANWDGDRVYRQLVVLVSFADCDFSLDSPRATYDDIFNKPGYNQRSGPGCVADYFRDQSAGLLNLQFDVYGPYQVSSKAKGTTSGRNWGRSILSEATRLLVEDQPDIDYSVYDWDGDGQVNQVIFVYAGYAGNQAGLENEGYIWPNTSSFGAVTTPDGYKISDYSASGELWINNTSCGIGTICHEFSHSFGLPDIYPTSQSANLPMTVVDEWDLMDGGPATNRGWCPPNYSPLEKMIMGWLEPEELTADTVIQDLKPVAEGGAVYLLRHTDSEFYLLENRQWSGWDLGLPGRGLVIYHVKFDQYRWQGNTVNDVSGQPYYSIVTADNMNYDDWLALHLARYGNRSPYLNTGMMNSTLMSTAAYPWQTDSTTFVNSELSATSVPAALMYEADANGEKVLSMAISRITQHADGTVSFAVRTGRGDGITAPKATVTQTGIYTLAGRRLRDDIPQAQLPKGIYIIDGQKIVKP